ncbi:MAG: PIN domain-containing protein [Dehalococcoidia bacterium]|nr:PIN domain-containing protein [Dehalococcoidia bacterium]
MSASRSTLHTELAFIDSSAYLALVNPHDAHHAEARAILSRLTEERWRSFTTNFVIAETHALFLIRLGHSHATAFLRQFEQSSTTVERVSVQDESHARTVIFKYDDKDFSLTDATSFAIMERAGIAHAFTFDHHFGQYGFRVLGP